MRDQGSKKGRSFKPDSVDAKSPGGTEGKVPVTKAAPMTAKEKIAANQKSKRRK